MSAENLGSHTLLESIRAIAAAQGVSLAAPTQIAYLYWTSQAVHSVDVPAPPTGYRNRLLFFFGQQFATSNTNFHVRADNATGTILFRLGRVPVSSFKPVFWRPPCANFLPNNGLAFNVQCPSIGGTTGGALIFGWTVEPDPTYSP